MLCVVISMYRCSIYKQGKMYVRNEFWFDEFYRESFEKRINMIILFSSDNEFLLCTFDSLLKIQSSDKIREYASYDSAMVITLSITTLQHLFPILDTLFFNSEALIREYKGKGYSEDRSLEIYDYHLKDKDSYPKKRILYLLIKQNELAYIRSAISDHDSILLSYSSPDNSFCQLVFNYDYTSKINNDTLYEMQFYPYKKYDLTKLYTSEDCLHVYDSIIDITRKILKDTLAFK